MNTEYKNIYFIGIGGIGMSAIARYYNTKGYAVSGYDKTSTPLTQNLESEGISIHYEDNVDFVPKDVENTLIIYTPAIPANMQELVYVQNNNYRVIKRSKMLGEISRGQTCLAVAGTHGKTSTSTLLAHLFQDSGQGATAFLGGISKNYNSNLLISMNPVMVAEADEFDRSFLQLHPEIAVITSMDADHLDIYSDADTFQAAFRDFAKQVSSKLIAKHGLPLSANDTEADLLTYSYDNSDADFYAKNIVRDEFGNYHFDLIHPNGSIKDCQCGVPGWVNVENSVAASAVALCYGLEEEKIKAALPNFSGVKRRFDVRFNIAGCTYIDDYAHHPTEIAASISTIKGVFPNRKLTGIFQPHLFTRTRDFYDGFAHSLNELDKLILLDIYPAREEPIPGVSSSLIFDKINGIEKVLLKKEDLMDYLSTEDTDILITFGAGNIDAFVEPITELLQRRHP